MGYRSDVNIITRIENTELVNVLKDDAKDELWDEFEIGTIKMYDGNKVKILIAKVSDVKWYESYPSVRQIMDAMHRIEDDETYGFIRLGEDMDDIETFGFPYAYGSCIERYVTTTARFLTDEEICECNNLDHQTLNVDCPVNNKEE